MSDFVNELRREVLEGHRRHRRRSRLQRAGRPLHPRAWRPAAVVAAAAVAAGALTLALAASYLTHPTPARPHVVGVVRIGGTPTQAAFVDGSLWVGDFRGSVVRIDPRRERLLARFRVPEQAEEMAAGAGAVWVRSPDATGPPGGPLGTHVTRIDPRTGKAAARSIPVGGGSALAVGPDALWVARRITPPEDIERIDPSRNAVVSRIAVANVDALAAAGATLWAIQKDGTVVEIDAADGAVVHTWPQLAPGSATASAAPALVADADGEGLWALSTGKAALIRVEADRVVRKLPISSAAQLLARTPEGLWVSTSNDTLLGHNRLVRIDPDTGRTTGALELGRRQPIALVAADGTLCVLTADGTVLLIR